MVLCMILFDLECGNMIMTFAYYFKIIICMKEIIRFFSFFSFSTA